MRKMSSLPGFEPRTVQPVVSRAIPERDFILQNFQIGSGAGQSPVRWVGTWVLSGGWGCRDLKLATHMYLMTRITVSGATLLLFLCSFMLWEETVPPCRTVADRRLCIIPTDQFKWFYKSRYEEPSLILVMHFSLTGLKWSVDCVMNFHTHPVECVTGTFDILCDRFLDHKLYILNSIGLSRTFDIKQVIKQISMKFGMRALYISSAILMSSHIEKLHRVDVTPLVVFSSCSESFLNLLYSLCCCVLDILCCGCSA
jgi:hypothetical protein